MAAISVVEATLGHAARLAETMREEDCRELATCGQSPGEGILACLAEPGEAWTVLVDGEVLGMVGVATETNTAWLLTSKLVDQKPKIFWRVSKEILRGLLARHGPVGNMIDSRYERALRWAIRLGFKYEGETMIGGIPFYRMVCRGD